jgi:hypothetical protein
MEQYTIVLAAEVLDHQKGESTSGNQDRGVSMNLQ